MESTDFDFWGIAQAKDGFIMLQKNISRFQEILPEVLALNEYDSNSPLILK